ncbi:tyrosine-protein phosphatase [Microbacterium sp. G2-8]|uniref:tyrosine-protein phosphatase n=1 Tax=Microbacterium sp. G2-8 TaxID=2842454 RepID=UPI001C8AADA2|nr:tyrosine-protein phosphatase [Microbacterium sp. G2-8]
MSVDLTSAPERRHVVPGVYNLRDTGGYRAGERTSRWGRLFRSDALHRLDAQGRDLLESLRIRHVVDLRGATERTQSPSAVDGLALQVRHLPIFDDAAPDAQAMTRSGLAPVYDHIVDDRGPQLVAAIRVIAEAADDEAVLVHCTAGKDRTGLVVGLALAAAGVERDEVVADYAATAENLRGEWTNAILERVVAGGVELTPDLIELVSQSPAPVMETLLARIDREHGTASGYLRAHGLTTAELDRLTDTLTA